MPDNEIRLPTCRSEEVDERGDPAPERRHVPKGKPPKAAQRQLSVIGRLLRRGTVVLTHTFTPSPISRLDLGTSQGIRRERTVHHGVTAGQNMNVK